eukprot:tig00000403_g262.t1
MARCSGARSVPQTAEPRGRCRGHSALPPGRRLGALLVLLCVVVSALALRPEGGAPWCDEEHVICFANGQSIDTRAEQPLIHHARLRARQALAGGARGPPKSSQRRSEGGGVGTDAAGAHRAVRPGEHVYLVHAPNLTPRLRAAVEGAAGVRLGAYLPNSAYLVTCTPPQAERLRAAPGVTWVDAVRAEQKVARGALGGRGGGALRAALHGLSPREVAAFAAGLEGALGAALGRPSPRGPSPAPRWLPRAQPLAAFAGPLLASGSEDGRAESNALWARGLRGEGQTLAIADAGLDFDHCLFLENGNDTGRELAAALSNGTRDFKAPGRSKAGDPRTPPAGVHQTMTRPMQIVGYWVAPNATARSGVGTGHGTHVAATAVGRVPLDWGNGTERDSMARHNGVAHAAKLIFQDVNGVNANGSAYIATGTISVLKDLLVPAYEGGARIHSNSWGCAEATRAEPAACNVYDGQTAEFDLGAFRMPELLVLVAAGNDGNFGDRTVGSPALCKNCIAVGASHVPLAGWRELGRIEEGYADVCGAWINCSTPVDAALAGYCCPNQINATVYNANNVAGFSSRGPAFDGRVKPDLVAPGHKIVSALSDGNWTTRQCQPLGPGQGPRAALTAKQGTSMATPALAGLAALVRQYFTEGFYPSGRRTPGDGFSPSSALLRAVLHNAARLLPGVVVDSYQDSPIPLQTARPDRLQGFGRPAASRALRFAAPEAGAPAAGPALWLLERNVTAADTGAALLFCARPLPSSTTNSSNSSSGNSTSSGGGAASGGALRGTLVWVDYPASPGAARALVNDLDLTLQARPRAPRPAPNQSSRPRAFIMISKPPLPHSLPPAPAPLPPPPSSFPPPTPSPPLPPAPSSRPLPPTPSRALALSSPERPAGAPVPAPPLLPNGTLVYPNGLDGPDRLNVVEQAEIQVPPAPAPPAAPGGLNASGGVANASVQIAVNLTRFASPPEEGPMLLALVVTADFDFAVSPGPCAAPSPSPSPAPSPSPSPSPSATPSPSPSAPGAAAGPPQEGAGGGGGGTLTLPDGAPAAGTAPRATPAGDVPSIELEVVLSSLPGGRPATKANFDAPAQDAFREGLAAALSAPPPPVSADRLFVTDVQETSARRRALRAPAIAVRTKVVQSADGSGKGLEDVQARAESLAASGLAIPGFGVARLSVTSRLPGPWWAFVHAPWFIPVAAGAGGLLLLLVLLLVVRARLRRRWVRKGHLEVRIEWALGPAPPPAALEAEIAAALGAPRKAVAVVGNGAGATTTVRVHDLGDRITRRVHLATERVPEWAAALGGRGAKALAGRPVAAAAVVGWFTPGLPGLDRRVAPEAWGPLTPVA